MASIHVSFTTSVHLTSGYNYNNSMPKLMPMQAVSPFSVFWADIQHALAVCCQARGANKESLVKTFSSWFSPAEETPLPISSPYSTSSKKQQ